MPGPGVLRSPVFGLTCTAALLTVGCAAGLLVYLLSASEPVFRSEGWAFVFGRDWYPGESYGAWPMIYGSVMVTVLALLFVLPLALGSAIYTSEFLSPRLRLVVKGVMELLAGVPGIIYGLLGVSFLSVWVRDTFGLIDGNTLLTASILLGIMILPTIMTLSDDALRAVPGEYRDTAWSLGLTRMEAVAGVVIPKALPGIAGAVFLGLGRAMGETIAVLLVIGGRDRVPDPWFDIFSPGQNIPAKLGREAAESLGSGLHWSALAGLGLILFIMVTGITLAGNRFLRRWH